MKRQLDPAKLIETSAALSDWITVEFAGSGLSKVAAEVNVLTSEAVQKAERIRKPNFFLRVGIILIILALVGSLGYGCYHSSYKEIMGYLDITKGFAVYLIGALIFLVTLEFKWKRWKLIKAVNELRAVAHIIDMHQLGKDHEIEKFKKDPNKYRNKVREYLHACTALLSLMSKIGELYVEHFPDEVATDRVDQFEIMCNGLNSKIWQKVIAASLYKCEEEELSREEA